MKLEVLNVQGEKTGRQIDLPEDIFGIEPNEHVLYLAVKAYNANQRQGTHKAKERNEVAGSTRKIKRQKGTGTARAGDIKNPMFRGGGRIFGPKPRDYSQKLNKKVKVLARKSALSAKMKADQLVILEDFTFETPKTSEFRNILNNLSIGDERSLFVIGDYDNSLYLSSRNLPKAEFTVVQDLHPYQVLKNKVIVISESAVEKIKESFA